MQFIAVRSVSGEPFVASVTPAAGGSFGNSGGRGDGGDPAVGFCGHLHGQVVKILSYLDKCKKDVADASTPISTTCEGDS
jgi:hypothetical protein